MQTNFTATQLGDPAIAASERVLRACVHCGFCTATCPTYVLLGDELDSPRGRIYLIKDMLENDRRATADVVRHLDRCLSCLACMTTCPSGVNYQHLIDHARAHVERTYQRPLFDRLLRFALATVLPHPVRLRWALRLGALARPFAALMPARLRAMLALVPRKPRGKPIGEQILRSAGPAQAPRKRVAVLTGCVQSVLGASINESTFRLLERAGLEPVPIGGCCGSLVHHLGRDGTGRATAAALIGQIGSELDGQGLDAVVVNASGCGTHVKDYGFIFRNDPALAAQAAAVSEMTRDITELLVEVGLPDVAPQRPPGRRDDRAETTSPGALRVAYHSACSMQHGQQIDEPPRRLLRSAGFDLAEIPDGHLCCGSAGTYNVLQPGLAGRLRERKLGNIASTGADIVATGNLGCIAQLGQPTGSGSRPARIVHTVELLDWATGGPMPAAMHDLPRTQ